MLDLPMMGGITTLGIETKETADARPQSQDPGPALPLIGRFFAGHKRFHRTNDRIIRMFAASLQ
jgi:hypothetical protein